jgi:hypothetical protein
MWARYALLALALQLPNEILAQESPVVPDPWLLLMEKIRPTLCGSSRLVGSPRASVLLGGIGRHRQSVGTQGDRRFMSLELRGIFLTSEEPEVTARFYRDVAELELEQIGSSGGYVYWKVDKAGLQLAIHDAGKFAKYTHPACPESNLTHLYFKIENQDQFLEHL